MFHLQYTAVCNRGRWAGQKNPPAALLRRERRLAAPCQRLPRWSGGEVQMYNAFAVISHLLSPPRQLRHPLLHRVPQHLRSSLGTAQRSRHMCFRQRLSTHKQDTSSSPTLLKVSPWQHMSVPQHRKQVQCAGVAATSGVQLHTLSASRTNGQHATCLPQHRPAYCTPPRFAAVYCSCRVQGSLGSSVWPTGRDSAPTRSPWLLTLATMPTQACSASARRVDAFQPSTQVAPWAQFLHSPLTAR